MDNLRRIRSIHELSYFSVLASTKICAGRRISELRGDAFPRLPLPVLRNGPLLLSAANWGGCTAGCIAGVSGKFSDEGCIISSPRRRVIISRKKHATAEAAEPFSFEFSKRRDIASPAACAA